MNNNKNCHPVYHSIESDGFPTSNGRYMVKVLMKNQPIYDNVEICFRNFVDGNFETPYYSNPETDVIVGWYED